MSEDRQGAVLEAVRRGLIPPDRARALLRDRVIEAPQAEQSSGVSNLWGALKKLATGEVAELGRAAKDLPGEASEAISDVGQSLLPTRGGAEAGGRTLGRLGELGMAASGGLAGSLGIPTPTRAGALSRGLDVQPRVAQVPRPQLALPPPTMGVPGRAPIETGPGQLRPAPVGGAFPYTPPPATGLIPTGPGSLMTRPEATPRAGAPTPKEPTPLVSPGAEAGQPSQIAGALVGNDSNTIDQALVSRYRRLASPSAPGQKSLGGLTMQDQRITTAVDTIIDNKNSLQLKTPEGNPIPAGRLPRTLDEFMQSIDHLKGQIFDQYDTLAKQQGGQGLRVPLQPAIDRLLSEAATPEVRDLHPALAREAIAQANRWAQVGSYSPKEVQNIVQTLNEELKGTPKNPTRETFSRNTMMSQVLTSLRNSLNQAMTTGLQGPQYQSLRNRYAALASIEGDVANALRKTAAATPGGVLSKIGDLGFWTTAIHGVATLNPKTLGTAASIKAAQEITRYLRSPNRAVTRLFQKRASELDPSTTERLSAAAAARIGELRQQRYNANIRGDISGYAGLSDPLARARAQLRSLGNGQ